VPHSEEALRPAGDKFRDEESAFDFSDGVRFSELRHSVLGIVRGQELESFTFR
jgi:hypothetical protein